MRSRSYYKIQTKFDRGIRSKPCDGKLVTEDPQLIVDVFENARMMDDQIRKWKLEEGIHWILGFEAYVKDKNGSLSPKFKDSHIFSRGQIVLVDFFGHFGTELTFEHPAIVLADTFDGVIIAPISSKCFNDGVDTHVSLSKNIRDLGEVKNNCGIKLEQSRFISKRRILRKFKRVSNTDKLNEIDEVLMKIMAPYSYNLLIKHQDHLLKELASKNELLEEKEKEIEKLNRRIEFLNVQIISDQSEDENVS
ncbi:type II toxin-antitoxin system PemK/MazF family toxin [Heyndrickxia acidicola]|uniref:Type II toxin-antitoxin system PemK/MazF family toxin n=1 Tax=Heyndrickxia acidicola TaxID=209389 RepID=A0ABU6MMG9_9BACI|nr:type II toxin-antitoxin system PemK/MazF family toxin [Heyndrickxia acidicola]MED1205879.1 type II toxin-antitoxin system PemK/MazF family toxin [Heyndrickxia acidicola]